MNKTKLNTKKERIVTALTITILKSSSFITLPQTFKRRSTTTKPRLASYTINGISAKAKINHFIDKTKLFDLINDFKIDNAEDFIAAIGKCFPQQVEKEEKSDKVHNSKYQLIDFPEFGVKILFRISDHNINPDNIIEDVEETYSIALKSIKSRNTFKPNDLTVTEYVFFTENCDCNRYKRIAENLLSFAETSVWDNNYVPADKINISPKESLDGIDEDFADKLNYFIENNYSLESRYDYFSCGFSNDILQACGLEPDIEIVITQNGMKKILGQQTGKKDDAHDLTPIEVLRLPQLIQKPILVITGNTSDTRLIFVEIPRRGRKMFAVVNLNIKLRFGQKNKIYNLVASVYSQENYKVVEKIVSANATNNVWYYDSTKIKSWLSNGGQLQLLPSITTNSMFSDKDFSDTAKVEKESENPNDLQENLQLKGFENCNEEENNGTFSFALHLAKLYEKGEKLDWLKAKKIAKDFYISTETEIMQSCELAIVLESRRIAQNGNSIRQQYEELKDLYERQVNIKPLDTKSKVLQQYSTPCPLAYLLGTFIKGSSSRKERYFEPSAGNGMLTIALPEDKTFVNEIDEVRISNLQSQNFASVWNFDSSDIKNLQKEEIGTYKGVITNPPFGKLERKEQISRNGWDINTLDYKMAIYALDTMLDNGRCAIIVGGKMWNAYWKPISSSNSDKEVLFGQFKTFLGYLYAQYNVVDVIYIDGDNIYRKQGTQYPIVVILVDGRHEYNENNKPNYVFDKNRDKILTTFDQIFDRIFPYLENNDKNKEEEKRAKALFFKQKMQSVKLPSLGNNNDDDIFKKYTDFIKEALSSKTHSRIECTELISEHSKRIVNRLLKKNINKYYLTADDIRHSRNVHGKVTEYLKNQIPITELDFIRIPEILYSPTNIDLSNPNTKNGQGIRFVKEYTDGKIFCVMIDEYETEELSLKTNYKKPPLQGIDVLPKAAPKHNVRNARALPMLNANVVNFFRIK